MSMQATSWALYQAPKNLDANEFRLLMVMADIAQKDGTRIFYSNETLADLCGVSKRTVIYKLRSLEKRGLIRPGDQRYVSHLPGNHRPKVWDLCMTASDDFATGAESAPQQADPADMQTGMQTSAGMQTGMQETSDRGANRDADCLHMITTKEDPIDPRESRARETKPNTNTNLALADWKPDDQARALATALGQDPEAEAEKFLDAIRANGKTPKDLDAAYRNWLRHGHELGIQTAKTTPQTTSGHSVCDETGHTTDCPHVAKLLATSRILRTAYPDPKQRENLRPALADQLNHGASPAEAIQRLTLIGETA